MTKEERVKAGDEARSVKLDLLISIGVKDVKTMGEIMFDFGRAYGLNEAAQILEEPS